MFRSIRWRIAFPYVVLILVTMLGLFVFLSNFIRKTYQDDLKTSLLNQARLVGDAVFANLPPGDIDLVVLDSQARYYAKLLNARVTLIAPDGTVIGESHEDRTRMDNHLTRPEIIQANTQGHGSSIRFSQTVGIEMMYAAVAVEVNGKLVGFARISLPLDQVQANVTRLQGVLVGVTVIVTILAIILATLITGSTTHSIRDLTRSVRDFEYGILPDQAARSSSDEVDQLSISFHAMAHQIQQQLSALEAERSKLETVLQKMTDAVLIVDDQSQVQLVNPAAERIFEIQPDQGVGHSLAEVVRLHQPVEIWQRAHATGEVQQVYFEVLNRRLYLQGIATPLGQALPGSILLLFQDISRQASYPVAASLSLRTVGIEDTHPKVGNSRR